MPKVSISIDVPDLTRAVTFYTDALECTKLREQEPNMVVLSVEGVEIYLLEKASATKPIPDVAASRTYERHWTPVHVDFAISDVEAAVARVVAAGGTHDGGEKGEWGEIAYCADPFGHGFCIIRE